MNLQRYYARPGFLYLAAIVISMCISFWVDMREAVINPDAICYLYSAEQFGNAGLHAAMHLCPQAMWPFYSVLIFTLAKWMHLSYLTAAFLLDAIFSAVSVLAFIAITRQLGGHLRMMTLAAIVILCAHQFNILRQDIIRDHGFWACYLLSILFLLRFFASRALLDALAFSMSLIVATCFRIEGAIFFVALPWLAWFDAQQTFWQRCSAFLKLNMLLLLGGLTAILYLLAHPEHLDKLGRLPEILNQLHHGVALVIGKYQVTKDTVSQVVLTHVSRRDAGMVVTLLLLIWYLVNVVTNLTVIYTLLVIYAWFSRAAAFSVNAFRVLCGYVLLNVAITFIFFAENHFLAKRYLIALSLTLMLWIPFALYQLISSRTRLQRILLIFSVLLIAISGFSSLLHFGHSKDYVRDAGDWLAVNVPKNAKLYVNDYQLMYYAQHDGMAIFTQFQRYNDIHVISHGQWKQYDYLAIMKGTDEDDEIAHVMQEIHLPPLQVFVSSNGSHVYIYRVTHRGD